MNRQDRAYEEKIELSLICQGANPRIEYNRQMAQWLFRFGSVRILSDRPRPLHLPEDVLWTEVDREAPRTSLWNCAVEENRLPWTLILESGEKLDLNALQLDGSLEEKEWPVARIRWKTEEGNVRVYHQPRLIPGGWTAPFDGLDVPDASRTMLEKSVIFGSESIYVDRDEHPFCSVRDQPDRPGEEDTPTWKLMLGELALDRKQPAVAASQFRTLLRRSSLLPSDRMAAMNGLASSYAEQNRWAEALELTECTISASPQQWLPYLIRYRLLELSGEKAAARHALEQYEDVMECSSRASMDRHLPSAELIRRQVRLDIGMGDLARALEGLDRLAERVQGEEHHDVVLRSIRVALQARDRDRAALYLDRLKSELNRERPSEVRLQELELLMDGMADAEWFDLLLPVYEMLLEENPTDEVYRRRLIVALSRTGHLTRARELMRGV